MGMVEEHALRHDGSIQRGEDYTEQGNAARDQKDFCRDGLRQLDGKGTDTQRTEHEQGSAEMGPEVRSYQAIDVPDYRQEAKAQHASGEV